MAPRILIDTNVLLDYLLCRSPYEQDARKIIVACKSGNAYGCIAAHSVSNIFFILRKAFSIEERQKLLLDLCELFEIESIDKAKIIDALKNEAFSDFEDCLQMNCAVSYDADYIVTRNADDFRNSEIPCIEPGAFCEMFLA